MDRRKFLSTLVGGVVAGAAVRSFPFRVFSFPKEIVAPERLSLYSLPPCEAVLHKGVMYGVARDGVFELRDGQRGWKKISQEIDIATAKRMFPGPFRWQDYGKIRTSVLLDDGSVVDF
jgi:hypothetical protein